MVEDGQFAEHDESISNDGLIENGEAIKMERNMEGEDRVVEEEEWYDAEGLDMEVHSSIQT